MQRTMKRMLTATVASCAIAAALTSTPAMAVPSATVANATTAAGDWAKIPKTCTGVKNDVGLTKVKANGNYGFANGKYQTFGTDVPVILIHGNKGMNKGQWGSLDEPKSFITSLNGVAGARVATEFQFDSGKGRYDNKYKDDFQPFANAIDCLATISKENGGLGKVIVIGYSEGSSIAHGASVLKSKDGKRKISDEIGQAITIADARVANPREGWFKFYRLGYPAANFPKDITTVHTVGGEISKITKDSNGKIISFDDTGSDDVIDINRAIRQDTSNADAGGGNFAARCYREYSDIFYLDMVQDAPCRHGELLKYAPVQKDVITAITNYVNSLTPTPPAPVTRPMYSGDLTFFLDDSWGDINSYYGNSSSDSWAKDLSFMSGSNIYSRAITLNWYYGITLAEYETRYANVDPSYGAVLGSAPPAIIGGRTPDYSVSYLSSYYYKNEWCYTDAQNVVCIDYTLSDEDLPTRSGPTISYIEPTTAVLKLFSTATWSY